MTSRWRQKIFPKVYEEMYQCRKFGDKWNPYPQQGCQKYPIQNRANCPLPIDPFQAAEQWYVRTLVNCSNHYKCLWRQWFWGSHGSFWVWCSSVWRSLQMIWVVLSTLISFSSHSVIFLGFCCRHSFKTGQILISYIYFTQVVSSVPRSKKGFPG